MSEQAAASREMKQMMVDLVKADIANKDARISLLEERAKSVLWVFEGNATQDERRAALEALRTAIFPAPTPPKETERDG